MWGAPIAMEHKILALVLRCFGALPTIPRELLPEALKQVPHEIHLTTAAGTKRSMFLNLAGETKAGFELTATVAMPALDLPAAPPVNQAQVTVAPKQTATQPAASGTGAPETVTAAKADANASTDANTTPSTTTTSAPAAEPAAASAPTS